MGFSKKSTSFVLSALFVAFILSCAVNPVTGEREFMLLSKEDEIALGKQTDEQVIQTYGIYDDPQLETYISYIGIEMAKLSHRPDLPYEFRLLDTPVINAFAVPGGFVYITRGILAYLNSEAEFAGVMGHEIGHITARHSAKQYSKAQVAQLGLGVGMILSETFRKYAGVAQFGVSLLFLKFSRDNESQSDRLGVEYSTKAGYDATHMANFFVTLDRMQPSDGGGLPGWLSTHPDPENRVVKIREMAGEWQQKTSQSTYEVGRDDFLNKINGIVYGEDSRQGFVENDVFYHPQLTFQFPVPAQWQLHNNPSQVQMISPNEDAIILFTLDTSPSPSEAAAKFVSDSKANVISQSPVNVNGYNGQRVISDLTSQEGTLRIMSYFIEKEQNIFVFHGFSAQSQFAEYQNTFQSTIEQFRKLNDASKLNVRPNRLRVTRAPRTGTLRDILQALGSREDKLEELSYINGKPLDEQVSGGSSVKVVEWGR